MMAGVAVVGAPFLDLVFEGLPRLPTAGEEVVGRALHVVPGGTTIQAIGIERLGIPATLVAPVPTTWPVASSTNSSEGKACRGWDPGPSSRRRPRSSRR